MSAHSPVLNVIVRQETAEGRADNCATAAQACLRWSLGFRVLLTNLLLRSSPRKSSYIQMRSGRILVIYR